jgi:DNA-binding response OmpR family regulator
MADMLPPDTRILVIDDDPGLLELLNTMLSRIGATPATTLTATEGLELLGSESFDLLILDLMLPDIDGFEVLAQLRQDSRFDTMPILILSAKVDPEAISRGLEMGADGYLTKPYLPNTLTSRVRSLLAQSRGE